MKLQDYLKPVSFEAPTRGMLGEESGWLDAWSVVLRTGRVHVADPSDANCEMYGCVVNLPEGKYLLQIRLISYGRECRVSGVRLLSEGATNSRRKLALGTVATDVASIAIYDFDVFTRVDTEDDARWMSIEYARADLHLCQPLKMADAPDSEIFLVATGFGDGSYGVVELAVAEVRVGFEIEFIQPGLPYPMG